MSLPVGCGLCDDALAPVVHEDDLWRVVVNREQGLLGKTMIVLRRHAELLADVRSDEWSSLHGLTVTTTEAIRDAFAADHFNYAFLQNVDRHVHLHVLPRYSSPPEFSGGSFPDDRFGDHYIVPDKPKLLPVATLDAVAAAIVLSWPNELS